MNTTTDQKANRIVPIIMMIALFGMISFVTNLAAPMGQVLKEQFGASNFQGLLGNAANFIAYAVMGIPGGILLQRVGYKKTALIAVAIGFLGISIQYLSGHSAQNVAFGVYLLGAFVAGFSMCLLNIVVNPMLNTLGGGGNKGNQLIQVGGSFNSVMATFTPAFVGILIGEATKANIKDVFPVMYIAMGVFALVFFVLLAVKIPEPYVTKTKESLKKLMTGALKFRHFVLGAIAIFVYVGVEVGTPYVMLYWLSDNPEVGKTIAGFVAGTYWFLMLIGRLIGASIGGKISSKAMLTTASFVGMILILLAIFSSTSTMVSLPVLQRSAAGALSFGMAEVPINAMYIVLVGLCTSIMWGGIFNLAVEGLGKYTAAASGIFMVLVCGGGILPAIQGGVADMASYMASYWVIFIGLAYLFYYAVIGSKNVNRNISVLDDDDVPLETAPQSLPVED
ncbi:MAG: MFS transporter [Proteiniphilum sp.]|nr:MFS transporter [Proteiniphilum sp.]